MLSGKSVTARQNIIYIYDGSFPGFLCCVFESVKCGELPFDITCETDIITMLDEKHIKTDREKAERVRALIPKKINNQALTLVYTVFLSCLEQKEVRILEFLLKAYQEGANLLNKLGDPTVAPLLKAERHLLCEAHLLKGFIRFEDVGAGLVGTVTPKNYVLPFISEHFISRYEEEDFLIFDKTHKAALIYQNRKSEILHLDGIELPEVTEEEAKYQTLWKHFYNTVAIKERINPHCRMTHMPKRYWENMIEVRGEL